MGNAEGKLLLLVEKGCGPMVTVGCCLLTCALASGTGVGAWVPIHEGSWAVYVRSQQESWAHWSWESCSAKNFLLLSAQYLGLPGSPEEEIGARGCGCVWESMAHSPLMTKSG